MNICKDCFNCKAQLKLKRQKDNSLLNARILYYNATIRCTKKHWRNDKGNKEHTYTGLGTFIKYARGQRVNNYNCPDFQKI